MVGNLIFRVGIGNENIRSHGCGLTVKKEQWLKDKIQDISNKLNANCNRPTTVNIDSF
jgi:hypothetical protein